MIKSVFYPSARRNRADAVKQSFRIMRLTSLFLVLICVHVSAASRSQTVTLHVEQQPITNVLASIEAQTGYLIVYNDRYVTRDVLVSLQVTNQPLEIVLGQVLTPRALTYQIKGKTIAIRGQPGKHAAKLALSDHPVEQQRTVSGRVTDEKGGPLASVTVAVKGTTIATVTETDGTYRIDAPSGRVMTLVFSSVGYQTAEEPVGDRTTVNVRLSSAQSNLEEVVVVGYGVMRKADLTGSVAQVKSVDIKDQAVINFDQALIGKMSGVQVLQTNGEPGRGMTFRVRGTGTISSGNAPLIVLDGIPLDNQDQALEMVNPGDIESVEVLKDASSAAIYGSRGANGVIMITTKKGKEGSISLNYTNITGVQQASKKIDLLNAYEFAQFAKDGHDNAWVDFGPDNSTDTPDEERGTVENGSYWNQTPPDLYPYLRGEAGLSDVDWQDAVFRNALLINQTVSASGGTSNVKYFVSANYTHQDGVVIESDYRRMSARLNLDVTHKRLKFGINFVPSYSTENRIDAHGESGVVAQALQMPPVFPVYNADGTFNYDGFGKWRVGRDYQHNTILNPVALATLKDNHFYHANMLARGYLDYRIIDGLQYGISLGATVNNYRNDRYSPNALPGSRWQNYPDFSLVNSSNGYSASSAMYNWIVEHTLTFDRQFGDHHVNALGGFTAQKNASRNNSITAVNYVNDLNRTISGGQVSDKSGSVQEWSILSYLARLQYNYKGKYLFSASFRGDGSSRFGANNKYGYFPAVSAGWRLSAEDFMESLSAVSDLKIRGSYGSTGNFQIGNYDHIARIQDANYTLGSGNGTLRNGLVPINIANPDLGWELSTMSDIGFDLGLFHQRIVLEAEYYNRITSNLLLNLPIPLSTGFSTARQNVGKVRNRGFDVTLLTNNRFGKIEWRTSLNFSLNRNQVLELGPEGTPIIETAGVDHAFFITQIGSPIGAYYLMKVDGVYMNQEDLDANPHFSGARPGDFKFVDTDGNGVLSLETDRTIVGSYFPDYTFGFTNTFAYKGIDLSFSLQGVQGVEIVHLLRRYIANITGNVNSMTLANDRWRSEADPGSGLVNRANRKTKGNNGRTSTWHVEDGSYIRLQNLSLGYTLPKAWTNRVSMGTVRLFFSGQNLFTWTEYSGFNPEVNLHDSNSLTPGLDYGTYPLPKTYSLGINVNF